VSIGALFLVEESISFFSGANLLKANDSNTLVLAMSLRGGCRGSERGENEGTFCIFPWIKNPGDLYSVGMLQSIRLTWVCFLLRYPSG